MSSAISTHGLTKKYRGRTALTGISFDVPTGSVFGVIGPNGAGKTTTMRLLLDIIRPTSGHATVLGKDPREGGTAIRRRIGFLPGELHLDGRSTGRDLLEHYTHLSGPVEPGIVDALAERLGYDPSRKVRTLSKGNKQKLGLIQAFMHQPDLLVLDEPTSGLDPLVQQEFLTLVREAKAAGQTVFLSSHVISEIQQAADLVAILKDGRIVESQPISALRDKARRRVRFIVRPGDPSRTRTQLVEHSTLTNLSIRDEGPQMVVEGTLDAGPDQLIKSLAQFTVLDLVIEEPDLEQTVLHFYSKPLESSGHAH